MQAPTGGKNHGHGGTQKSNASLPMTLADILPGAPTLTWEHVAKSYRQAQAGDYEGAVSTMINVPLDKEASIGFHSLKDGFCKDCTVLVIKTDLVYEDGVKVDISNGVYVHHAVSFDLAWKEMANWINLCPFENKYIKDIDIFSYFPPSFNIPVTLFGNAAVDEFQQWYGSPNETVAKAGYYIGQYSGGHVIGTILIKNRSRRSFHDDD